MTRQSKPLVWRAGMVIACVWGSILGVTISFSCGQAAVCVASDHGQTLEAIFVWRRQPSQRSLAPNGSIIRFGVLHQSHRLVKWPSGYRYGLGTGIITHVNDNIRLPVWQSRRALLVKDDGPEENLAFVRHHFPQPLDVNGLRSVLSLYGLFLDVGGMCIFCLCCLWSFRHVRRNRDGSSHPHIRHIHEPERSDSSQLPQVSICCQNALLRTIPTP